MDHKTPQWNPRRRRLLAAAASIGLVGVAGCSGQGDQSPTGTATGTSGTGGSPDGTTATRTPTPTDTEVPPANFTVELADTNDPVTETEFLVIEVTVENTGGERDNQTVVLRGPDGNEWDSAEVMLAGGERRQVTLRWSTERGDAGDYTVRIESEDDALEHPVTVESLPEPEVVDVSSPDIDDLRAILVEATVENPARTALSRILVAEVEIEETTYTQYREISLPPGATEDVFVKVPIQEDTSGTFTFTYRARVQAEPPDGASDLTDEDFLFVNSVRAESVEGENSVRLLAGVRNISDEERSATVNGEITSDSFDQAFTGSSPVTADGRSIERVEVTIDYRTDAETFYYSYVAWVE